MLLEEHIKILLKLDIKLEPPRAYPINKINREVINKIFSGLHKQERIK